MVRRSNLESLPLLFIACLLYACSQSGTVEDAGQESNAWFTEESAARGISFKHQSGHQDQHLLPEIVGSGVALTDVDNDGWLDVYIVQSGSLYDTTEVDSRPNQLYRNKGDGTFELELPLTSAADKGYGMGVTAGDFDDDGDNDLFVTNVGTNRLFENIGNGLFRDITDQAGLRDDRWSTSAAFIDLDRDGDLDLFYSNYLNWSREIELDCYSSSVQTYCPPTNYRAPAMDRLFRNNGDGTFTDITREAGIHLAFGNGFGVVSADYDENGFIDVFVANDLIVNQLWMNQGNLNFVDEAMVRGSGVDGFGATKAGMGVASTDLDQDGDFDILVVNLTGETDSFFRNEGTHFSDATSEVGLSAPSRRYTRFGVTMADFNNDGWLDLYEANGGVSPVNLASDDIYAEPNMLFRGTSTGRFEEVSPHGGTEAELIHTSRGLAVGDVNNDGGLDMVVINRDAQAYLLMNRHPARGNWISFSVRTRQGRDANGAVVAIKVDDRRVYAAVRPEGSYLSSNDPRVHFGLGTVNRIIDVRVLWPDREVESFGDFDVNQIVELHRGKGEASEWTR